VNRNELKHGAAAGLLAGASTTGALIALGMRTNTASKPFNVIASHLLGPLASNATGLVSAITVLGVAVHLLVTAVISLLVLRIVRHRLLPLWLATATTSLLFGLVSVGIARRGGQSLAQLFPMGDVVVYHLILGLSLAAGIRFADPAGADD